MDTNRDGKRHTRSSITIACVHICTCYVAAHPVSVLTSSRRYSARLRSRLFRTREKSARVTNNGASKGRRASREIGAPHISVYLFICLPIYYFAHWFYTNRAREILRRSAGSWFYEAHSNAPATVANCCTIE